MKKLLAILMPSLLITTGINNIKLNNSNDVATVQKITTKSNIKNSNVYAGYTNAENTIIDILNHGVSNYSYLTITTMIEAEIYGFNIKTDKNYSKELNDKFNSKIEQFLDYIWSISYILPTDKTYLRVYLNIAYHYMPLYIIFPYMYNKILENEVLNSKQKTNLTALVALLRKNDGNFNTGYKIIHGVNEGFENDMLHVGDYNKLLDTIVTFNPDNKLNGKAQYVAAGWGYYGFHLFYNETTKKSYVYYKGNPMWKYNMGSIV